MAWSLQSSSALSESQFVQWSKLLEERTGIQLMAQQRTLLQSQVAMRMRELGCTDYNQYYERVTDGLAGMMEWSVLVDRLAVKETSFFRHRPSLEFVRNFLQNRINNQQLNGSFDVWSLGCATGEEPYSLAMVINDCFELATLAPYYGITATDISTSALNHARKGIYTDRKLEQVTPEERQRYFKRTADGQFEVAAKLRDRICFTHGNVLQAHTMPNVKMDVIYCQNLLVYFRRWLRRDQQHDCADRLKPGGVLIIGLGEAPDWEHPKMRRVADERVQAYIRDGREE
jgi:chemotaxis protein methyltransferase CheR/type IV pilus assembly protein PilK